MKPLIGITMNPDTRDGDRLGRLYSFYMEAVREAGGVPVMLFDSAGEADILAARLDGLLLSGGDDVDPALYGQPNTASHSVDAGRDAMEVALLQAFMVAGKPVLGICRGIQLMAAALGGSLYQHIPDELHVPHPFGQRHEMLVRRGTFLSAFLPERVQVNSTHHQSVRALPPGFLTAAVAPDGVIEAMQAVDGSAVYGVQFHPERLYQDDVRMVELFRLLIK